jgi:predicted HicB family RNase H-like nuclease
VVIIKEEFAVFSIRIPVSLKEELQRRADAESRSLNNLIALILKKAVADGR